MPAVAPSPSLARLTRETKKFGCPELVALDGAATADHLNYLDLLPGRGAAPLLPQAVAEFQGRPVLYLIDGIGEDGQAQTSVQEVRDLGQLLANRSEHACLAVVRPGELTVYPLNLDRQQLDKVQPHIITVAAPEAPLFFQSLATGALALQGQAKEPDYVFDEIHYLLTSASEALAGQLAPLDVLSITGRALFFRFLHDRRIVLPAELGDICPKADNLKDVFTNAEKAAATSCWLDETFNGDLLPLVDGLDSETERDTRLRAYRKFYREAGEKTQGAVFRHLEAILRGWKHVGGSAFQITIDWDDFNFAHIPIGVLSQVYETFSRQWDEVNAEKTSVYYTPKNIARLLVEEALAGVKNPEDARVLDAACGAGVFLVLAFRQLVRLHWQKSGHRPDKNTIHRILYQQICGFDISESALRLAALALYVTAIEVNGTTRPPKILKFPRALKNEVLFNFGPKDAAERKHGFVLGSLSPEVPATFNGQFDVVVGNPPWTRLRPTSGSKEGKAAERARHAGINREFTIIAQRVLKARGLNEEADQYSNPDNNPDLPFLWRAAEWGKPGGMIAMALPARIILKQGGPGRIARDAMLRGLTVMGILNGSDLEKTAVWPNMDLPFMLLFARNARAADNQQFYFVTPVREQALCEKAEFRIDYQSAQAVSTQAVRAKPWLLKTLGIGTTLDVEVLDKLFAADLLRVGQVWNNAGLFSGEGYNISPGLVQNSADHLHDLPDFELPKNGFAIEFNQLQTWRQNHHREKAHAPRDAKLYRAPLVIVPQTPGEGRDRPKACLSKSRRVAFSKSFYGYSTAGNSDADILAPLLYLAMHSLLWQHFFLTNSSRIGASYRTILKEDLDAFPFPDPGKLTAAQKRKIATLAEELETAVTKPWDEIDDFIFGLYGLSKHDATVVRDTVKFGAPYRSVRQPAERPPEPDEAKAFGIYLSEMVQPFLKAGTRQLNSWPVALAAGTWNPPWRFLVLAAATKEIQVSPTLLARLMQEASRTAASRVIMELPDGGLLLGLLNQRRFWTHSRARLCGVHIIRQHLAALRRK